MLPIAPGAQRIVGREIELEELDRFVSDVDAWPGALIVEGSPGIGKSTLLEAGVAAATGRSCDVLRCRPTEHESRLSFAALRDLLEDAFDETAADLPEPQRRALSVALLREVPALPLDRGAVSAAFLSLLRERSRTAPVLVVADDIQWLDGPTAVVLAYAARRLRGERVGLVFAQRAGTKAPSPLDLERALSPERVHRIRLGPLSIGALQVMLRSRLDRSFPRPILRRIHESSAGNPFFALEIAERLAVEGRALPGMMTALPLPHELGDLLRTRIDALPDASRTALLFAAAASHPSPELLTIASGLGASALAALDTAERAGVIELGSGSVRFTHPLLASTVWATAASDERRTTHRALAQHVVDPEERARHLALASVGPDATVAAALEEAAASARARAAPESAADLADLARELTPPEDEGAFVRRGVGAAGYHFDAGNAARAQELFRQMADAVAPGPERSEILWRLADASWNDTDLVRSHLEEGLDGAEDDLRAQCRIRWDLAWTWIYGGDLAEAESQARRSYGIAERLDDATLLPEALAALGMCEFLAGRDGAARIERASSLQARSAAPDVYTTPTVTLALRHLWAGELDAARSTIEPVVDRLAREGLYTLASEPNEILSEVECRSGRLDVAAEHAATAIEIKLGAGFADVGGLTLYPRALVDAHRGDVDVARERAAAGLAWSEQRGDRFYANANRSVLGSVELSLGRFAEAREHLDVVVEFLRRMGVREPGVIPVLPDAIEARIGTGDVDGATELLSELEEQGGGRPWARATAARCRGMLLAARGDTASAATTLEHALAEHPRVGQPLELARTLLAAGEVERRAKHKMAARAFVERAIAILDDLGAKVWLDRARVELARTGRRASSSDGLTPTERRIAELVATGASNREVAAAAFISVKTVEANLTRIYAKLGVRSRAELAHQLAGVSRQDGPAET